MTNKHQLDQLEKLLRQRRPAFENKAQQLCWERGFLTGLLASLININPEVRRFINAKIANRI